MREVSTLRYFRSTHDPAASRTENPGVGGSIPSLPTTICATRQNGRCRNSASPAPRFSAVPAPHRLSQMLRREVRIATRHPDVAVPERLGDGPQGDAGLDPHLRPRLERVTRRATLCLPALWPHLFDAVGRRDPCESGFSPSDCPGEVVENAAIRAHIEAALARRNELFALGHLAWTVDGYTVKFRLSVVDIVRTAVEVGVFEDPVRVDGMLDEVRRAFQSLSPLG
jgi:hypothetical protein